MHIVTSYDTPERDENGKKTGRWHFHSMATKGAVLEQIRAVLRTIEDKDGYNAEQTAEWVDVVGKPSFAMPEGDPFAAFTYGGSEGYVIRLMTLNRRGGNDITPFCAIKYLADKDFVYRIVRALNDALNEGMYVCEEPPASQDAA